MGFFGRVSAGIFPTVVLPVVNWKAKVWWNPGVPKTFDGVAALVPDIRSTFKGSKRQ